MLLVFQHLTSSQLHNYNNTYDHYYYYRYGGGLSVRGAIDIVHREIETIHLEKLRDRDYLFGRSTMVELNYYVDTVR
jgi:hypothetical protein